MMLNLSRIHFPVTTLGPGKRIGIWFQGCSIRCSGCISADTWGTEKGRVSIDEVMKVISTWLDTAEGITISGGEPFEQPEALELLLTQLRTRTNIDILVYSGHSFEKISPWVEKYNGLIDALISDPYEKKSPQTLALRGSDNQRLHCLTALGKKRFHQFDRLLKPSDKTFDIMFEEEGVTWLAGIPRRDDLRRLKIFLEQEGHIATITQEGQSKNRMAEL